MPQSHIFAAPYCTGQCGPLSYPIWHSWACTHMTWDTPAHDIFGFKMTSRQRGAQQAGRSSVREKRSSRRRTSLLSSLMTSSHSPSPQLLWNNSQPPGYSFVASPLPFFSCTYFLFFFLLCLTPPYPSTPPEMWVDNEDPLPAVTCLLRASENRISSSSTPIFLDVHLPFNNVGEGALSFQRRGCQPHALFLLSAAYIFIFPAGAGGETERFAWRQSLRLPLLVSRSPVRLHASTPLRLTDNEEDYRQ